MSGARWGRVRQLVDLVIFDLEALAENEHGTASSRALASGLATVLAGAMGGIHRFAELEALRARARKIRLESRVWS